MNNVWRDCLFEAIEREFVRERRLARKEFEDRNHELTETLIAELNERKKAIEHDNLTMELCMWFVNVCLSYVLVFNIWCRFLAPDSADLKPAMTRKLRRRPNDPVVPAPQEKRRKPPPVSQISYMLQDHEIEQDLKAIQEAIASMPSTSTTATTTVKTRDTVNSSSVRKPGQYIDDSITLKVYAEQY